MPDPSPVVTALARRVGDWWWAPYPAARLARLRILVGLFATVYVLARTPSMLAIHGFARSSFAPIGPLAWLPAPVPSELTLPAILFTSALGMAMVLGWHYRLTALGFALGCTALFTYRSSWSMIFHTDNLLLFHVILLAASPAADVESLDAKAQRSQVRFDRVAQGYYGWPVRLLCVATVITYVIAGHAKLTYVGWDWCDGDTLRQQIAYDNVRKLLAGAPHAPLGLVAIEYAGVMSMFAVLTLVLELGAPLALLSARAGYLWSILAWSFHVGVLALMAILFAYPVLGFAYLSFFPLERWRWRKREKANPSRRIH